MLKAFTTVSSRGVRNKLSDIANDGADYGPDTSGTSTCGLKEALQDSDSVILTGGRYILKEALDVGSGKSLFGGQNSVVVNETDDLFEPFMRFDPYTICNFLAIDANHKSGVQIGRSGQNNSISIGTLKVFNCGEIYSERSGSQASVAVRGYNIHFDSLDILGGNTGLLLEGCTDIRAHDALVVNAVTGVNINSSEHVYISNLTVDSCRYVGLQIDSSHDVAIKGTIWNNLSAYPDSALQQAVLMGRYSAGSENSAVELDLRVIGTGGTAIDVSNCKYCKIDASIMNINLNTATGRIRTGIRLGDNLNHNAILARLADVDERISGSANATNRIILE